MIIARRTTICDLAQSAGGGKVNLLGLFDSIHSTEWPATVPPFFLFSSISSTEEGELKIGVTHVAFEFVNEAGENMIAPFGGPLPGPDGQGTPKDVPVGYGVDLIVRFEGLKIPKPGDYALKIKIDGNYIADFPVKVRAR